MRKLTTLALLTLMVLCVGSAVAQQKKFEVEQTVGASYNIQPTVSMGVGIRYTIAWKWLRLAPHARFMYENSSNTTSNYWGGNYDREAEARHKFFGADFQLVFFHARTFSVYPFVSYERMFTKSLERTTQYVAPESVNITASCRGGGLGVGCNFSDDLAGYIELRVMGYGYQNGAGAATAGLALRF